MKPVFWLVLFMLVLVSTQVAAKGIDEYITEATGLQEAGDLKQAVAVMEEAVGEYPESADAYAYLGLYRSMQAGQVADAGNFMEAGSLSQESFAMLDRALEIDPKHINAHLYRGIIGIQVPEFMGMLPDYIGYY